MIRRTCWMDSVPLPSELFVAKWGKYRYRKDNFPTGTSQKFRVTHHFRVSDLLLALPSTLDQTLLRRSDRQSPAISSSRITHLETWNTLNFVSQSTAFGKDILPIIIRKNNTYRREAKMRQPREENLRFRTGTSHLRVTEKHGGEMHFYRAALPTREISLLQRKEWRRTTSILRNHAQKWWKRRRGNVVQHCRECDRRLAIKWFTGVVIWLEHIGLFVSGVAFISIAKPMGTVNE